MKDWEALFMFVAGIFGVMVGLVMLSSDAIPELLSWAWLIACAILAGTGGRYILKS